MSEHEIEAPTWVKLLVGLVLPLIVLGGGIYYASTQGIPVNMTSGAMGKPPKPPKPPRPSRPKKPKTDPQATSPGENPIASPGPGKTSPSRDDQ